MTHTLVKFCNHHGLIHRCNNGELQVKGVCNYPEDPHWITLTLSCHGKVGVMIFFPLCRVKKILDVYTFCAEVQKMFVSKATFTHDDGPGMFLMHSVVAPRELREHIAKFSHDCDIAKPLLIDVGNKGRWYQEAIRLARVVPSSIGSAH